MADAVNNASRSIGADIRALKEARDNVTNFWYIGKIYLILLVTITSTIWFFASYESLNISFWWTIPVAILSIVIVGGSQHQLGGALHEGVHHILFRNRLLNELISDWLCAFPIYSSTYQYRIQHLAHHQFVNDPERDPDILQLKQSGHDLEFPLEHYDFVKAMLRQLWLLNPARYTLARARHGSVGGGKNVYNTEKTQQASNIPRALLIGYAIALPFVLNPTYSLLVNDWQLTLVFLLVGLTCMFTLAAMPGHRYPSTALEPVVSHKVTTISRIAFLTVCYTTLSAIQWLYAVPAWTYFVILWALPLFTTFSFFMILRQWVQHGNADRGRYTNTRVFKVDPFTRYAVFPFGMDYHLPHHMYANVPHFKLKALHKLLLATPAYKEHGIVVDGYFGSSDQDGIASPSAVEVLGPEWAAHGNEAYVDSNALADTQLADPKHISNAEAASLNEDHREN